jgi:protein-tyrosine kinase
MSKIEEALKKAKALRGSVVNVPTPISSAITNRSSSKQIGSLDNIGNDQIVVKRESSVKEIELMDCGELMSSSQLANIGMIHSDMLDTSIANTYRGFRTKLIQKSNGKNFVAMFTSSVLGNDSSITSLNLATAFALDESKTALLIDCNINNPQLDTMLGLDVDTGLTDYLDNEHIDVESMLYNSGVQRLNVIPAGTSREAVTEHFTSLRMRKLMENLITRYSDRYIFVDAPPILESADTRILVELCDFVVLVVPYGKVTKNRLIEAANAIGKEKLLGIVFCDIPKLPNYIFPEIKTIFRYLRRLIK